MTPERLLLAAMHSIIDTTSGNDMKRVNDYLGTHSETYNRFAWLPKTMSNDKRVWLKKYVEVRYYADIFGRPPIKNNYYTAYWTPEDHTMNLLRGDLFKPDHTTEFTGHVINHARSHSHFLKMTMMDHE